MAEKCLCEPNEIVIFSCAGSSNVGQLGNQTAIRLAQDGMGRYLCLAGIGGHVSGMIESAKAGKMLIATDSTECLSLRLRISLLKKILSRNIRSDKEE
jgi:uncharacterized metal-binding protein